MEKLPGKGHRLLLMPSPLQGHITPFLQLADILYSKGFSITIIHTLFNSPNTLTYHHFTFHAIPDGLSQHEASTSDPVRLTDLINIRCEHPLKELLATLLSQSHDEPIACFVADVALHFTRAVCDGFRLPRLLLRTAGASSFLVFASFPLLREKGCLPIQESQLEEPVVELPPLKVKDLPRIETCDPEAFYNLVCRYVDECKASSGVIWNSFEELESSALARLRHEFSIPIYPIGPFHKHFPAGSTFTSLLPPDESCIPWLDRQEHSSVVYVSFGSMAAISEAEFLEIASGLANSNQPFLWVIRPGLIRGSEWFEPLPSGFLENLGGRGYIVKWAPQEQVLSHPAVGAFWTHNGWNSTLESICEGVPMICSPCFSDQKVNAKYVSDVWRVGVQLQNKLERGEIERTITKLMIGDEGNEIRQNILNLKEKSSFCLKIGGSSYCSLDGLVNDILSLESSTSRTH